VTGWSIDSRSLKRGDLFFAIRGENHDGHGFVNAAFERGAVAAIASEPVAAASGPILPVADTTRALQELGKWARVKWGRPIVAVTGSAGKTTTKDVISELLAVRMAVGKSLGNLNNHLGLPLSLLRMPQSAEVGITELGMNHSGEIRFLASLAQPEIGVVTNIGYAHIESFDSIDGVALAKRELIEALPASGTAVLNADDARVAAFRTVHSGGTVTYGVSPDADIRADGLELDPDGAAFSVDGSRFRTRLAGRHGVSNILAGIAVARIFGIPTADLVDAAAELKPGRMRGERHRWRGVTVLDDSYNSNPDAARAMIDVLRAETAARHIAVLGEMLELGSWSSALHEKIGEYAASAGIDVIIGVRGAAKRLVQTAKAGGVPGDRAIFFDEPEEAGNFLREFVRPGDAILFKGSRGTHVERALAAMES
jgi:UDP-N-acetylmuramoyl-tripeptide--D-alanyl-D-alanine ligase